MLSKELSYIKTWYVTGVVPLENLRGNSTNTFHLTNHVIDVWLMLYLSKCLAYKHFEDERPDAEDKGDLNATLSCPKKGR